MKRTLLFLSAAFMAFGGMMQAAPVSSAANDGGDDTKRDDLTVSEGNNSATFSWSGNTLTITGKGELANLTVTDENTKVFSATGAGKVYTKSTTTTKGDDGTETTKDVFTAVKKGDGFSLSTEYYEATMSYGEGMTPSTQWNSNYSMTQQWESKLVDDKSFYACYWSSDNQTLFITELITTDNAGVKVTGQNPKNTEGYYYFCVANTADKDGLINKTLTEEQMKTITLINDENLSNYLVQNSTIKALVDNLYYSTDNGTTKNYLAKDASYSYTGGNVLLYTATVSVTESGKITDNSQYFTENHADYLESLSTSFVDYLPFAIGDTYSTVIIKTESGESTAHINNAITRALTGTGVIKTLNLQDTYLPEYVNHCGGDDAEDASFFPGTPGQWTSIANDSTITTLYAPSTGSKTLGRRWFGENMSGGLFDYLTALENLYLGEGIETLDEEALAHTGHNPHYYLKTLVFPNSLKTAKKFCMNGQKGVNTLTFPANMEKIESNAFNGTDAKDVYFLGLKAPEVEKYAWGENNYISNNAFSREVQDGESGSSVTVNVGTGYAVRATFHTGNGWMAMLHYPANCTKAEAAKYTDLTRKYKKIVYGTTDEDVKENKDAQDVVSYYYEPGKEEANSSDATKGTLKGEGDITGNEYAVKRFVNTYPTTADPLYGGNYNGGYDDMYVGTQYTWPSLDMAKRALIVAINNKLWDGVTTIAEGIKKYDNSYSEDGSKYIGLHQFVFAQGDVTSTDTREWDMSHYADGKWHSICVPFSMTKAQMKEVFGTEDGTYDNLRLCKFDKVDRYTTGDNTGVTLYFDDEQFQNAADDEVVLQAHVSYMIHAPKEKLESEGKIVFKNYVLESGSAQPTNVQVNGTEVGQYAYYFIGQYQTGVNIPQYSYFFSKSAYAFRFQLGTEGKWNAYTGIVEAPNGEDDYNNFFKTATDQKAVRTALGKTEDGGTTGIDKTIVIDNEVVYTTAKVYDLNGRLVSNGGTDGLSKGIYIVNGKKVLVK